MNWKPIHFLINVSASVGGVMRPAGDEAWQNVLSMAYLKDPKDKQRKNDPVRKEWRAFKKKISRRRLCRFRLRRYQRPSAGADATQNRPQAPRRASRLISTVMCQRRSLSSLISFCEVETALYQARFGMNVTEWRILSLLAIGPGIPAARICNVIGFDNGPVNRTLTLFQEPALVSIKRE